jgi:hypothetical protein
MTRNEAIEKYVIPAIERTWNEKKCDKIKRALEQEPLTDMEQRIFLAAMKREERVCKESGADGDGWIDLVAVCHSIESKVKKVLWR